MISFFSENLGWKVFSLAVAVFLWISFSSDPEIGTFVSVPVEYRSMPDDLEISSDIASTVSLDVRGSATRLREFSTAPSGVVLDLSGIHEPGERTFQIDGGNVQLPSDIRLVRAIPTQLRFRFEKRTQRDVPVQVRLSGEPQPGYQVDHYEVTPQTMTVVGPESRVNRSEFAVTDPIDLSRVVGVAQFSVDAFVPDPHVRFLKPTRVTVRVYMEKR